MIDAIFSVIYDNGICYFQGTPFPAGSFVVEFLNDCVGEKYLSRAHRFLKDRPAVHYHLEFGFTDAKPLISVGKRILKTLEILPNLCPFSKIDFSDERERIKELFSLRTADEIYRYCVVKTDDLKEKLATQNPGKPSAEWMQYTLRRGKYLTEEIRRTINYYTSLGTEVTSFYSVYEKFAYFVTVAHEFQVTDPVGIANFTFIERSIMHYTNYTLFSPNESEPKKIVKELSFPRYGALLLADFFECLSVGNFAQRCEICGKYFLTSIKKPQRYCNGLSNEVVNGSRLTCHQVAAKRNKKESSKSDPRKDVYRSRTGSIRVDESRGIISKDFSQKAKALAKEYLERAIVDFEYAVNHYREDMKKDNLYAEVKARWNIEC